MLYVECKLSIQELIAVCRKSELAIHTSTSTPSASSSCSTLAVLRTKPNP